MSGNRTCSLLFAIFVSIVLQAAAPARAVGDPHASAQTPSVSTQSGGLTIVVEQGVQADGIGKAFRDFGTLDALNARRLDQTFHLRNSGQSPIHINYIQPSCGCATVVLSAEGSRDPYTIAPGAQVAVRVTVDLSRVHSGPVSKLALIYVKGTNSPAFTLEMRAELPALVSYTPRLLNFGRLDPGVGGVLTLTVTIDKRLLAATPPPKLICNNPDIQITPQAESPASAPQSAASLTRSYTLTLAHNARLGVIGGAVAFVPGDAPAAKSMATPYGVPGIIPDALGGGSAILSGQILGKLVASSNIVVFASIPQGKEAIRQIQLAGATPEILKDLALSCSQPTMSARVLPSSSDAAQPDGNGARPTIVIEIRLSGQTPAGGLSGEVTVTAKDGERLVIAVLGDITKTGAP